jgi:hypothetical protein
MIAVTPMANPTIPRIPLTPSFLIAAASSLVGVREDGGNNRGHMIELFLRGVNQSPGQPWCAAFVHHVGYWSHFDYETQNSSWPLAATASCYMLGVEAKQRGVLREAPEVGDVFLLWNARLVRFAHTGVVARLRDKGETPRGGAWFDCDTIEGNTDLGGSREGDGVLQHVRRFYPKAGDRFIRWADLDPRALATQALSAISTSRRVA